MALDELDIFFKEIEIFQAFQGEIGKTAKKLLLDFAARLKFPHFVLALSHSDYLSALGGTEKVLHEEQAAFCRQGISYVQVHPCLSGQDGPDRYLDQLVGVNVDSVPMGQLPLSQLALILRCLELSKLARMQAAHLHHLMHFSLPGLKYLLAVLRPPRIRVFLHDYYTVCPQFNLLKDGRYYCGGKPLSQCTDCESQARRSVHFPQMEKFFNGLGPEFIAPSTVAAAIWARSFPGYADNVRVVPHQIARPLSPEPPDRLDRVRSSAYRPKIAYVGYENVNKGMETWWRLISHRNIQKGYELFHLGASGMDFPQVKKIPVSFLQDGPDAMLRALQDHEIDIAFLWSIWPETYSFTLHEAFAANCFVVTNPVSGNIAAQLEDSSRGIVLSDEAAMLAFFADHLDVKKRIARNLEKNPPLTLTFNPRLAEETRQGMEAERSQFFSNLPDPRQGEKAFANPATELWYGLGKLERELDRADNPQAPPPDYAKNLSQSMEKLAMYEQSRPHRLIEYLKQGINHNPAMRHRLSQLLRLLWRIASKLTKGRI